MSTDVLNQLLDSVVNPEEMETEFRVCPEIEANATIKKAEIKTGTSEKMVSDNNAQGIWANLRILWEIDSEEARQEMQRDDVVVPQSIFLKVCDDDAGNPQLDFVNNQEVARLLKMFELEGEMTLQEILDSLAGQLAFVKVEHRPYNDQVFAEVTQVGEPE